ncbi:MAG TPA: nucleotide sugar dehydrogenase, partial [Nitrospiria bacterium]|nr:nucleotide sugar dehydrogenase [Nitrospiria bacterium]
MSRSESRLIELIETKKARVGVIGMGYVGLPLAVEFGKCGLEVTGIDLNAERVSILENGKSYIPDVPSREVEDLVQKKLLRPTTRPDVLKDLDAISICVPTPLRKTKDPDLSFILASVKEVSRFLRPGQLIILESTTYPGTTDELLVPLFEEKGFTVGKDIFLAFSPERVDPGNPQYKTKNIPKVVGGATPRCTKMATTLYRMVMERVYPVSNATVAEMVKLLENTFRSVNIGLVNEIALMCDRMGIDVWEVIDAAKTKPFGFMPFYPGPGIGGHCIPLDPFYLSWKAKQFDFESRFIELAGVINGQMPHFVVGKVIDALNRFRKSVNGAKVLILGVAYKKDISDVRESPALDIMQLLSRRGAKLSYCDPHVPVLAE